MKLPCGLSGTAVLSPIAQARKLDVKVRFSGEQIFAFLREAEASLPIKDLCRRHGRSDALYYLWRSKFGGKTAQGQWSATD